MQAREIESFDFQTKVREQQEANRKLKSPFSVNGKMQEALNNAENARSRSKDVERHALDFERI